MRFDMDRDDLGDLRMDMSGRYVCDQCGNRIAKKAESFRDVSLDIIYGDRVGYTATSESTVVIERHLCLACYFNNDFDDEDEPADPCPPYSLNIFDENDERMAPQAAQCCLQSGK